MRIIKEISIIVGASIIAAFAANYFSPGGIALVGQWDIIQGVITAKEKNDIVITDLEIGDVTLARKLYDSGEFVFVDARSRDDYEEGHIKGAVSFRWVSLMKKSRRFWNNIRLKKPLLPIVRAEPARTATGWHNFFWRLDIRR